MRGGAVTRPLVPFRPARHKAAVPLASPRPLAALVRVVVTYALPARCPGCGALVGSAVAFCLPCWTELAPASSVSFGPPPADVEAVAAATTYNRPARAAVLALKHGNRPRLATPMGGLMAAALPELSDPADTLLVPVPLHRSRLWRRRYNQAAQLGGEVARRRSLAHCVDGLHRVRPTAPQQGGRAGRSAALAGAFQVAAARRERIAGRRVILVDDVMTTGATASHCARALREAGARSVQLLCWARVTPSED